MKNVGQVLLAEIMAVEPRDQFLQKLKELGDDHTFRYANIDFLFWFQFQNRFSDLLAGLKKKFETLSPADQGFLQALKEFDIVVLTLFDIFNCEKCTNIAYFSLADVSTRLTHFNFLYFTGHPGLVICTNEQESCGA